jgi:hypothetical protein
MRSGFALRSDVSYWHKADMASNVRLMSALGGKADMPLT